MPIYNLQKGEEGVLFTNFYDADTGILKETPARNPKGGQAVFRIKGAEDEITTVFKNGETVFGGIQIRNDLALDKIGGDAVAFMKKGTMFVLVGEDVDVGDEAYYDTTKLNFGKSSTGVKVGGFFKSNCKAGELALLEIV